MTTSTELTIGQLVPEEFPLGDVAAAFRAAYGRRPWGEYWHCAACDPLDNYAGKLGRYAEPELAACPRCGGALELYWSDRRFTDYFQNAMSRPGFFGIVAHTSELVGWSWGYNVHEINELADLPPTGFYVDVVFVTHPRYTDLVFQGGHQAVYDQGFGYLVTRTRRDATHVHRAMARNNYYHLRLSDQDAEREYWQLAH